MHGIVTIPFTQRIKVPALSHDAKLSERNIILFHPTVRHNVHIGIAREALQHHMQAMLEMHPVHLIGTLLPKLARKIVPVVHLLAQRVQAVDLVEDVNLDREGVVSPTPQRWRLEIVRRVVARAGERAAVDEDHLVGFGC